MIDQSTLVTYLTVLLAFVFIPGPAVFLTLARAGSSGTRVGLATGLGIALGDLIHTAMAVIGLSAIILTSAFAFNLVKYLGAAYLIYLGIRAIIAKTDITAGNVTSSITARDALHQAIITEQRAFTELSPVTSTGQRRHHSYARSTSCKCGTRALEVNRFHSPTRSSVSEFS